jgi:hypothetical protein
MDPIGKVIAWLSRNVQYINENILNSLRTELETTKVLIVKGEQTEVDKSARPTNKQRDEIKTLLNEIKELKPNNQFLGNEYRLDNPINKGAGHWEIQCNGKKGKTTIAQVHAPNEVQEIINLMNNNTLQREYDKLISGKLKESLSSGVEKIRKAYVTADDLIKLFRIN